MCFNTAKGCLKGTLQLCGASTNPRSLPGAVATSLPGKLCGWLYSDHSSILSVSILNFYLLQALNFINCLISRTHWRTYMGYMGKVPSVFYLPWNAFWLWSAIPPVSWNSKFPPIPSQYFSLCRQYRFSQYISHFKTFDFSSPGTFPSTHKL